MTLFASSPVNGKISVCFSASTSIDLDHKLTANGSLVPKLVIAMGAPMIKCHADTTPAGRGFRSGDARDYRFANAYRREFPRSRIRDRRTTSRLRSAWGSAGRLKTAARDQQQNHFCC